MPLTGAISPSIVSAALLTLTTTGSEEDLIELPGDNVFCLPVSAFSQTAQSTGQVDLDHFRSDQSFQGIDGSGLSAVIIDTGIDLDHPFFGPNSDGDGVSDRIVYS
jgi:hypothetical protein